MRQVACRFFALVRNRPIVRDRFARAPAAPSASIFCGVGARANRRARRLVDAAVGGLRRQQHRGEQLEHAGVLELARRLGIGVAQRREEGLDVGVASSRRPRVAALALRRRARAPRGRGRAPRPSVSLPARRPAACAVGARRRGGASSALPVARVAARAPASACAGLQACQPVRSPLAPTSAMQSTGQTGRHSSQPVHSVVDHGVHALRRADDRSRPGRP